MSIAFLIRKDFNQISAEQKSENFELYHKIFNTSVNTSTAWQINGSSFHIEFTLFVQAEFLQADHKLLEKFCVLFFLLYICCIKVTVNIIHWTSQIWSAFSICGDPHVSFALGSVSQVDHQDDVPENKIYFSMTKRQNYFLGLHQTEKEQIWKIFLLPFLFPSEEIRHNSLYVNEVVLASRSSTEIWVLL